MKSLSFRNFLIVITKACCHFFLVPVGFISLSIIPAYAETQMISLANSIPPQTEHKNLPGHYLSQTSASKMDITLGKSTLLKLPAPIKRISVGSPSVADVMLINPQEVYILGKIVGMTNLTLWTRDGKSAVIDINVFMDVAALSHQLHQIMPEEKDIRVTAAGDSLIMSGFVSNTLKADRAITLADAFIRTSVLNMMMSIQGNQQAAGNGQGGGVTQIQNNSDSPGAGAGPGSSKVINLLQVRDNQQVMLEVRVSEVNQTEAERQARAGQRTARSFAQAQPRDDGNRQRNRRLDPPRGQAHPTEYSQEQRR